MTAATRGMLALTAATLLGVAGLPRLPRMVSILSMVLVITLTAVAALSSKMKISFPPERGFMLISVSAIAVGSVVFTAALHRYVEPSSPVAWIGWVALSGALAAAAFGSLSDRRGRRTSVAFFTLYGLALGWLLAATVRSSEFVDVTLFQTDSAIALRDGLNPFAITFMDPYGALSDQFYGAGVSIDGVLQFGYPYLPLSLLAVAPFEWVLSDFRVAHAIAVLATAVVMSRLSDSTWSRGAAVVFLLIAPIPYVVRFGWTEPLVTLAAIVVMYSAAHHRRGSSYIVGALVALKQYAVLFLPASLLLFDRPWSPREIAIHFGKIAGVMAITILPFFLWDPDSFFRSVIELQFIQPFRPDSLAFPAIWAEFFGEPNRVLGTVTPLLLVAVVSALIWMRAPTGAQGFALGSALILLVAFAFSKQAFDNYYLLVIGLLCGAGAAQDRSVSPRSDKGERDDVQLRSG